MTILQYDKVDIDTALADLAKVDATLRSGTEPLPPDPPPVVVPTFSLVARAPTVLENAGVAIFDGKLSEPTTAVVTVRVKHQAGSATAGTDFQAVDTVLRFDPGETVQSINVPIINDTAVEGDENFALVASEEQGCTVTTRTASIVIKSDDVVIPPDPPPPTTVSDEIPPIATGPVARYAGTTYTTLLAAINAAPAGAVIEVLPGRHVGQKAFVGNFSKRITLRGILDSLKRRPFLDGSGLNVPNGLLTPNADLIAEYLGFTNVHNNNNAAGIWTGPNLLLLIVRWCMFKSNDNGFLGSIGNPNQKHLFEDCYFIDNGYGATLRSHNLYGGAGEETKLVRVRSHKPYYGMCAKTRCRRFIIEDSEMIQGARGNYALDMPNGGTFLVKRTLVRKPSNNSENSTMIQMCGDISNPDNQVPEGGNVRVHQVLFEDCILDNQLTNGIVVNNSINPQTTAIVRRGTRPSSQRMEGLVRIET